MTRQEGIETIIGDPEQLIYNDGFEYDGKQWLAVEYDGDEAVWAMTADSPRELARAIEESDTSRDYVDVWDLDSMKQYQIIESIVAFNHGSERINVA